jgi:hypothetical protein
VRANKGIMEIGPLGSQEDSHSSSDYKAHKRKHPISKQISHRGRRSKKVTHPPIPIPEESYFKQLPHP